MMPSKTAPPVMVVDALDDSAYEWMVGAACKNAPDADLFFDHDALIQQDVIDKYCLSCPAMDACFEFAVTNPRIAGYGIWGGRTANELTAIRRKQAKRGK